MLAPPLRPKVDSSSRESERPYGVRSPPPVGEKWHPVQRAYWRERKIGSAASGHVADHEVEIVEGGKVRSGDVIVVIE